MAKPIYALLMLAWALWLGGLVVLLLFVTRLFGMLPRPAAVEAAPVLFVTFASYQIIVGLIACGAGTLLAIVQRRTAYAIFTFLMLGALTGAVLNRGWTHQMENMRAAGESGGPEFKAMHAKTSIAYTSAAGLLLAAGIGFSLTSPPPRTGKRRLPAQGFPVVQTDQSPAAPVSAGHAPPR